MLRSNTAGSLRPLTRARCLGQTELPQTVQGVTDAFTVPHAVKRAVFFSASNTREVYPLRGAIHWRKQRPGVRETPAALHWPGSVVSAFFCILRACLETHLSIMKRFNSMLAMAI